MKTRTAVTLMLIMFIKLLCVGCNSQNHNDAKKENVDSLNVEERILQLAKEIIDSTANARSNYKQSLGYILPEWKQNLEQKMQEFETLSLTGKVQCLYSSLEHNTSVSAWNRQLKMQGYDISDDILKQDSINDIEMVKQQHTCFDVMRSLFAKRCREEYWIDDIDVRISGNRNQYIHFIGAQFATNRNIKEFHDDFGFTFEVLRFAQVRYSWYNGGKYTYFNIYDGKDSDPIPTILEGEYWWGTFPNTF